MTSAQAPAAPPVTFRIIVVSSQDRAEQVAERLRQGADFATLAQTESLDPSAAQGGLIGPIALSELRAELRDALRDLPRGGVTGVLAMPTGYALVQRVEGPPLPSVRGSEVLALSAASSVKATISVDGFAEAETALSNLDKPADWNQDFGLICGFRQQAVERVTSTLSKILAADASNLRTDYTALEIIEGHVSLAQMHAYTGDMEKAIKDLEQAIGVAYVHKTEMDHGLYREPGDRCLLSLRNQVIEIREMSDRFTRLDRKPMPLGGRRAG